MLSFAKNAGMKAKNTDQLIRMGKEFILEAYQQAFDQDTLKINIPKNKISFALEMPDNSFCAVGQLTLAPTTPYGWKFSYQAKETSAPSAEKSTSKQKTKPKPLTALEHLEKCGFKITQQTEPGSLPPIAVQRLAWKTGEALCDPVAVEFLQFIRTHMQGSGSFSYRLPKDAEKKSILLVSELAQAWDRMGLFASIVIYPQNIVYTLAENEAVCSFLSGRWLELFVVHQVQQLLKRCEEQGAAVSLSSNVILSDEASTENAHELDVVFSINGAFYWVEAKSSSRSIDYGKYAALCAKLQVTPDHLLLVNSDLSTEDCDGVSYFWNYRVANCTNIAQALEDMVRDTKSKA